MPSLPGNGTIVVLTGAGISKESGLDTFRDKDGIWAKVRMEDVATPDGFRRDPAKVHAFYNARRRNLAEGGVAPNAAHAALARLEREWPGEVLLVTQNIDDLHERAGSENLIHMHGELLKIRCVKCARPFAWTRDLGIEDKCPDCYRVGSLRPHVVWFGEVPLHMERIFEALAQCALFLSIGTSGHVYPAAGFVQTVRGLGRAQAVELNLEPSEGASLFHESRLGPASRLVPAFVEDLLSR
ncbi:Sir2 family NAD+-dependent deacetylase [Paramagnetospirillum magneticum]|uniref:NAD-dependent protein deacylase n=1 Tax=Paramagnetospirillum magneticum (strain ATCC 700264 / AMB-1) TaxID=342108 RepID=Q2W904_PARM1|nr:Sir2 family NAD+-dependent deacetylase [Paramagnetospirillum magneticum]BAE49671.1 NAD-dependent protein deacetylase [Paramagnetospirillum magneticum AMB-1]